MALTQSPVGSYTNVTGVVNTTAAGEIVVLGAEFISFIQNTPGAAAPSPDFCNIPPESAVRLVAEFEAFMAAIAAAPTA